METTLPAPIVVKKKQKTRLDRIKDFFEYDVPHYISEVKYWIAYRTYDRYNVVKTGLPPAYYEPYTLMLHTCFNLLVDFVEVEKAWMEYIYCKEEKNYKNISWFKRKIFGFRSREMGMSYLDWDINESGVEHQSKSSQEIKDLYIWWKDVRPNRPDPMDASGWSEYCRTSSDVLDFSKPLTTKGKKALYLSHKIEEQQEKEDEKMLIRLMKVRRRLWT